MRIVIIEDDELSLTLITEIIEEHLPNNKIVGGFSEAEEALEFLQSSAVDLIITDIKLPGMDGITFSKICSTKYPDTPIIIISGYCDFEYARKIINTTVVNYILKPITYESIEKALNDIEEKKIAKITNSFFTEELIRKYELLFQDYFSNNIKQWDEKITEAYQNNRIKLKYIAVISIKIFEYGKYMSNIWNYGEQRLLRTISNVMCSIDRDFFGIVLSQSDNVFDIICIIDDLENQKSLEKIPYYLLNTLKITCRVNTLLKASPIENIKYNVFEYSMNKKTNSFSDENEKLTINLSGLSFEELKHISSILCENIIMNIGIDGAKDSNIDLFKYQSIQSYEEIKNYINMLIEVINEYKNDTSRSFVEKAIRYIEDNYDKKITLEIMAKYVSYSPKYFSRVFKKVTNKTFTEYIDDIRIKKAISIIENDEEIRTQSLASKVGYDEYTTFYRSFKKHVGKSVNQYRDELKIREKKDKKKK